MAGYSAQTRRPVSGFFVSIEGVEGVGKSTNHRFVCDYFESIGHEVIATREPGGTAEAEKIREVLLDASNQLDATTEALLMFAARREHVCKVIVPALEQGKTVVSDRFVDASFAYQGGARELGFEVIEQLETLVVGTVQPDLTLLLDLDVELGLARLAERGAPDRIEAEGRAFFESVRNAYMQRAEAAPQRIKIVDASGSMAEVQAKILSILKSTDC